MDHIKQNFHAEFESPCFITLFYTCCIDDSWNTCHSVDRCALQEIRSVFLRPLFLFFLRRNQSRRSENPEAYSAFTPSNLSTSSLQKSLEKYGSAEIFLHCTRDIFNFLRVRLCPAPHRAERSQRVQARLFPISRHAVIPAKHCFMPQISIMEICGMQQCFAALLYAEGSPTTQKTSRNCFWLLFLTSFFKSLTLSVEHTRARLSICSWTAQRYLRLDQSQDKSSSFGVLDSTGLPKNNRLCIAFSVSRASLDISTC